MVIGWDQITTPLASILAVVAEVTLHQYNHAWSSNEFMGGKNLPSKTLRIATLEGEDVEVHRITNQGLWRGVTILLLIWSAGFSLPVTALMMPNSGIAPLQASTSSTRLSFCT